MNSRTHEILASTRRITLALLAVYVVYLCALWGAQRHMLFVGWGQPYVAAVPKSAETWWLDIDDGRVEATFIPARNAVGPAPAVVLFHGNAETIHSINPAVAGYVHRGFHVLLPEYRGFGRADGEPSQDAIVTDMVSFYDRLAAHPDVDPKRIVFHGTSLGGGVAAALSRERKPKSLILQSTFTSIRPFAMRFFAPSFLARDPFDTQQVLKTLDVPTLILHGTRDEVVEPWHSVENERAASNANRVVFEAGHFIGPPPGDYERYWKVIDAHLS